MILFFFGLLPYASVFLLHFPDERHYVDGALQMLDSGDYWVPRTAEGEFRFKKPILSYWLTSFCFAWLGVSELAARLPFLLAGCCVLWLTWHFAWFIFGDRTKASLSAAILLCQTPFILASQRSLPDVLLCFGLLLAAYGCFKILLLDCSTKRLAYTMLYGGVLLALHSKGMLALAFLAYAWIYALIRAPERWLRRTQWHVFGLLIIATVGSAWFFWINIRYPDALSVFVEDQIREKLEMSLMQIPKRWLFYILYFIGLGFLPWILAFFCARSGEAKADSDANPYLRGFVLAWLALCIVVFSFGYRNTTRYLLPLSPLLAILSVDYLCRLDSVKLGRCFGVLANVLLVLLSIVGILLGSLLWQLELKNVAVAVVLLFSAVAACGLWLNTLFRSSWRQGYLLAIGQFLLWPLMFTALYPVLPDSGAEAARILRQLPNIQTKPVFYLGTPSSASRLRLSLKGESVVISRDDWETGFDPKKYSAVVLPEEEIAIPKLNGYIVKGRYIGGFRKINLGEAAKAVLDSDFKRFLQGRTRYFQVWVTV